MLSKKIAKLTVITKNQANKLKAEKLAALISETLKISKEVKIEKYPKFENSYKMEYEFNFENENSVIETIEKTDRLCSPWNLKYDRQENEIELIFNKKLESTYKKTEFNVISWAYWRVEKENS